jgi:hypothetical protein
MTAARLPHRHFRTARRRRWIPDIAARFRDDERGLRGRPGLVEAARTKRDDAAHHDIPTLGEAPPTHLTVIPAQAGIQCLPRTAR